MLDAKQPNYYCVLKLVGFFFFSLFTRAICFRTSFLQIEMMSESIDETLDKDEAEEETEELTNQVNSCNIFKG